MVVPASYQVHELHVSFDLLPISPCHMVDEQNLAVLDEDPIMFQG